MILSNSLFILIKSKLITDEMIHLKIGHSRTQYHIDRYFEFCCFQFFMRYRLVHFRIWLPSFFLRLKTKKTNWYFSFWSLFPSQTIFHHWTWLRLNLPTFHFHFMNKCLLGRLFFRFINVASPFFIS